MNKILILDCTLRDGGYCNDWMFGEKNIHALIRGLLEANVDIIECGYISQGSEPNANCTKYSSFEQIEQFIPTDKRDKLFVGMINYGEYRIDDIPICDGKSIDGIRVCFHKEKRFEVLDYCKRLKEKGYKVFIQGMVTLSYSEEELIDYIEKVNGLAPFAFYIVDSFGMMKEKELLRLLRVVEKYLKKDILIGFHSHNNMQLAYSNSIMLTNVQSERTIIIDSSVYGMGRGAGNLNTELFSEYLNENMSTDYKLKPLLTIVDDILADFHKRNYWGYNLPNYVSAKNNAHPNYAKYLDERNTLTIEDMENILSMMDSSKKVEFDAKYIEGLYIDYLAHNRVNEEYRDKLFSELNGGKVILVAPGKSILEEKEKIARETGVVISVNFDYPDSKYIFLSNLRRYRELDSKKYKKCIVTSNIECESAYLKVDYKSLTNGVNSVSDNAGLMAIKLLIDYGVEEIALAGFDGYSHDANDNYVDKDMKLFTRDNLLDEMNEGMVKILKEYTQKVKISFVTKPKWIKI